MTTRGHHGILLNGGVSPPPSGMYLGVTTTTPMTGSGTTINVQMPAVVNVGDLLLIQIVNAANNTPGTPSGWTSLVSTAASTTLRQTLFTKVADGTEGGATVAITASGATGRNAVCHRFAAGEFGTLGATGASDSTNTSNAPNPPSRTSGLGSVPTFWFALIAYRNDATVSSYPLAGNQFSHRAVGGATQVSLAGCSEENSLATLDPGAFSISAASYWIAHTVSIEAL